MPVGGFRHKHQQNAAARSEESLRFCSGDGGSASASGGSQSRPAIGRDSRGSPGRRHRRADLRRGGWNTRSKAFRGGGVLGGLTALFSASSSQGGGDSDVDGDVEEANEPELGEARAVGTASEASSSSATAASGGGVLGGASSSSRSAGDRGDRNVAVDAEAGEVGGGSALAVGPGISWVTLTAVVASQVAFVGLFGWISSSAIRECNRMKVLNIKMYDLHT